MYDSLLCVVHSAAAMAYLTYPVAVSSLSLRLHAADSLLPYYSTITYRYSFVFTSAFPYASALNSGFATMMPGTPVTDTNIHTAGTNRLSRRRRCPLVYTQVDQGL